MNNESLALVVNFLGKLGGDSMVGSCILDNKALVTVDTLEYGGLLYRPLANICPVLFGRGVLLFGVRRCPSFFPVVSELLKEGSFDGGWLWPLLVVYGLQEKLNLWTRKDHVAKRDAKVACYQTYRESGTLNVDGRSI